MAAKSLHGGNGLGTDYPQPWLWGIPWLNPGSWDAQHKGFVLGHCLITTAGHVMKLKPPGSSKGSWGLIEELPKESPCQISHPQSSTPHETDCGAQHQHVLSREDKEFKKKKLIKGRGKRDLLRSLSPTSACEELLPVRHSFHTARFQKSQEVTFRHLFPAW